MATITILPEANNSYRARAGDKESTGCTAGEALDALTSQLEDQESGTLVIVQNHKADQFFNAAQQERLTKLMQLYKDSKLSPEEEGELESLVETEREGARRRVEQKLRPGDEAISEDRLTSYESEVIITLEDYYYPEGVYSPTEIAKALGLDVTVVHQALKKAKRGIRYRTKQTSPQEVSDDAAQASVDELEK